MAMKPDLDFSALTPAERLQLAQDLWDSVGDAVGVDVLPLTDEQRAELEIRRADLEASPDTGIPWDDARRQILEQLKDESRRRRRA